MKIFIKMEACEDVPESIIHGQVNYAAKNQRKLSFIITIVIVIIMTIMNTVVVGFENAHQLPTQSNHVVYF